MSEGTKQALWAGGFIAFVVLSFIDSHYWHSAWSYEHYGKLTHCHVNGEPVSSEGSTIVQSKFKCLEGEVTLSIDLREIAP